MRTNYVLIDYENLQPEFLERLDLEHFRVMVFIGANQTKIPIDLASSLQRLGSRAQYLRISGAGRNALDFHIAFYLGELLAKDPTAVFHIIAADTGYDPLVQHLKDRKVHARRHKAVSDIPHVRAAAATTLAAKVAYVAAAFAERNAGLPSTVTTLRSTVSRMFPEALDEAMLDAIIKALTDKQVLTVKGNKVTYGLSCRR